MNDVNMWSKTMRIEKRALRYININLNDWASTHLIIILIVVIREQFLEENVRETTDNGPGLPGPGLTLAPSLSSLVSLVSLGHSGAWDIGCQDIMMKLFVIRWDNIWDKNINPQHNIRNIQKLYNVPSLRFRPCCCPLNNTR